jgi:hypothetical protein
MRAGCRAPRESPYFKNSNLEGVKWQVSAEVFRCRSVLGSEVHCCSENWRKKGTAGMLVVRLSQRFGDSHCVVGIWIL